MSNVKIYGEHEPSHHHSPPPPKTSAPVNHASRPAATDFCNKICQEPKSHSEFEVTKSEQRRLPKDGLNSDPAGGR